MIRAPLALALALLPCSCLLVGPDYAPPEIPLPATYADRDASGVTAGDLSDWWRVLDDPLLDELIASVRSQNLDLLAAVERVEVARATYGIAWADRLPTIDGTGSYQRVRPAPPFPPATIDQYSLGGSLTWEIDLFGRVRRSVESARSSFEAQIEDLHGAQVALLTETVATYLQMRSLQERIGIADANLQAQQRSFDIAERRQQAGMTSGLDPAQARINLHTTQARMPALELDLQRAQHRLAVLTGRDPRALLDVLRATRPLPELPKELMVGIPADLLRNRPDLRSLERQLAAQSARIGVAVASQYPSINLAGSWDWLATTPAGLFDGGTGNGSIGPLVRLPLFNAGRLRNNVSAEEAAYRAADLALRQRVLLAQEEVENALIALVRDRRQADFLQQARDAADQAVEFARLLYTSGQSDFQNVLDAQRSLFSLADQVALARLATLLDVVEIYRTIGGGWGAQRNGTQGDE